MCVCACVYEWPENVIHPEHVSELPERDRQAGVHVEAVAEQETLHHCQLQKALVVADQPIPYLLRWPTGKCEFFPFPLCCHRLSIFAFSMLRIPLGSAPEIDNQTFLLILKYFVYLIFYCSFNWICFRKFLIIIKCIIIH